MDRVFDALFELAGILMVGLSTAWFMDGKTEFLQAWTIGGAVAGFFVGMASGFGVKALIYRMFEDQWPTLH